MPRSLGLFAQVFVGPVCLALAAVFHGWLVILLLGVGAVATLVGFVLTRRAFTRAEQKSREATARSAAASTAEAILDTAVEFLHASGIAKVRANFMRLDPDQGLRMTYKSSAYRAFEIDNTWHVGDGSCASKAIELRVPVLGGYPKEYDGISTDDFPFRVDVLPMRVLKSETTRAVLCVPVARRGHGQRPVGLIVFDDVHPLRASRLKDPAIVAAVKAVADTWLETVDSAIGAARQPPALET
jgi:hypothetical protein